MGKFGDLFFKDLVVGVGRWGKLDCLITESKEIMFQIGQANNSIIHTLVRNVEKLYIPREKGNEKS